MARKKALTEVRLRVLRNFDLFKTGEELVNPLTERVVSLVSLGFMEVVFDGTDQAGPGSAHAGDPGGSPADDQRESDAGAEPGEGFGSGGYGSAES